MYGLDFFFKAVETGMKMAQQSVENFFRFMELSTRNVSTPKPIEKTLPEEEKRDKPAPDDTNKPKVAPKEAKRDSIVEKRLDGGKSPSENEAKGSAPREKSMENHSLSDIKAGGEEKQIQASDSSRSSEEASPDKAPPTAIGAILGVIADKQKPLATEEIMEATGFTKKKVQSNLYKLKKRGEIKMVEKGVYVKL